MSKRKADPANLAIVQAMLESLTRCAYLLWAIDSGDHKALRNAGPAAAEAAKVLRGAGQHDEWMDDAEGGEYAGKI